MAWVFVRLKARLLANGLRGQSWRLLGVALGAVYCALLSIVGFFILAGANSHRPNGEILAVLFGTALALGWATFPLLGFGSDETLDPVRLALLPLSRRQLMAGLLAASLVGIGPLATLVALCGGIVGFATAGVGGILVVLAAIMQLVLCVSLSRAVVTALSSALRSRRGKDLRIILVALVALAPQLLRFALVRKGPTTLSQFRPLSNVLRWLPFALPMRAMAAAGAGHVLAAVAELIVAGVTVALLLLGWSRSLNRISTTAEKAAAPRRRKPVSADSRQPDPLFGQALAWLPRTRLGAVTARETRVTWRDPRRRVQLLGTLVLPFIVLAGVIARGVGHRPSLVYAALLIVAFGEGRANNQLGVDGRAWWIHEATGSDLASDLRGKNVSLLLTTLPSVLGVAVLLAALTGAWPQLVPVVPLAVAMIGVELAIGNMLSVRAPWPMASSSSNLWGAQSGQGCLTGHARVAWHAGPRHRLPPVDRRPGPGPRTARAHADRPARPSIRLRALATRMRLGGARRIGPWPRAPRGIERHHRPKLSR